MGQGEMLQKTLYILACLSLNVYDIYIILRVRYRRMGETKDAVIIATIHYKEKCYNNSKFIADRL